MKDELLTAEAGGPSQYWRERWVWLPQQLNRVFKRIYKAHAQSRLLFFIPYSCLFKLYGRLPADLNFHIQVPNLARALFKTSSTSSSSAVPASISLILRHISISQASATPFSAGPSRLATRVLANFARSLSESDMAAFVSASNSGMLIIRSDLNTTDIRMHQSKIYNNSE